MVVPPPATRISPAQLAPFAVTPIKDTLPAADTVAEPPTPAAFVGSALVMMAPETVTSPEVPMATSIRLPPFRPDVLIVSPIVRLPAEAGGMGWFRDPARASMAAPLAIPPPGP